MSTLSIAKRYEAALVQAKKKLSSLDIVCGRSVSLKGLSGWVFEQTVRTCLEEEMERRCIWVEIVEQAPIAGRASVDLLIGSVAVEVKAGGFIGDMGERYATYRKQIEAKGWHYFYLTLFEGYDPYVKSAKLAFGKDRAFFLDQKGEWRRFVSKVMPLLKKNSN